MHEIYIQVKLILGESNFSRGRSVKMYGECEFGKFNSKEELKVNNWENACE